VNLVTKRILLESLTCNTYDGKFASEKSNKYFFKKKRIKSKKTFQKISFFFGHKYYESKELEKKTKIKNQTMEIKIRRRRGQIAETTVKKEVEEEEQPLSPAARLFHAPEFNCYIISVVGLKNKIEPDMIIEGIKQTLMRHPRFSSKLVSHTLNRFSFHMLVCD